ncbi:MAG: hypothetical protein LBK60_02700 [Verrucomicrobiales bacterium]|jgi:hypothetical protein|nr:hypothetical protein [Verrucomicrobiales bacterium]
MSLLELKRLFAEWRVRVRRIHHILQPPVWSVAEWNEFARALAHVVRRYGRTWETDGAGFWDIRWALQESGELVCQVEQVRGQKLSLVVAQYGGFADGTENYIWFYCEFSENGGFLGEPFWVEGVWKDALSMLLLPHKASSGFYLTGGTSSPAMQQMLLGNAAPPQPADGDPP